MILDTRLVAEPISAPELLADFLTRCEGAGAVVSFCGLARATSGDGDAVKALHLLAHPRLTALSLERIGDEALSRFPGSSLMVVHRHGSIRPREVIVFVASASAHRRLAFLAADYAMDQLKTDAVFWKKEEGADGSRWIEPTDADREAVASWSERWPE
jgi:molybdopterin synthase catalytic subunit